MDKESKIFISGHTGMVGSSIYRRLRDLGYRNLLCMSSKALDLRRQEKVEQYFSKEKPDYVFIAAAKVGGIYANNHFRGEFIYDNILIAANLIHSSYLNGVKKVLFLGSSCVYPKLCEQPISEEYLLTRELESTNEPYALAKIAGIKLIENYNKQYGTNYISCMPTNLYGLNDNYHEKNSHVLPALIRKIYVAKINNQKEVIVWGDGSPLREFLYVDDLADACLFLMQQYNDNQIINVGSGQEISIRDLAELIKRIIGYNGNLVFDVSMPNGTPRKLLNCNKINSLGWSAKTSLEEGIKTSVEDFRYKYNNEKPFN